MNVYTYSHGYDVCYGVFTCFRVISQFELCIDDDRMRKNTCSYSHTDLYIDYRLVLCYCPNMPILITIIAHGNNLGCFSCFGWVLKTVHRLFWSFSASLTPRVISAKCDYPLAYFFVKNIAVIGKVSHSEVKESKQCFPDPRDP